eukprot:2532385-Alexandrium_andersonii.AAC.1
MVKLGIPPPEPPARKQRWKKIPHFGACDQKRNETSGGRTLGSLCDVPKGGASEQAGNAECPKRS